MNTVKLFAIGDISLQTKNSKHPFENVRDVLQSKDVLFGNLETVLSNQGKEAQKAVSLHLPPERVSYLKDASFDILNIANNHIMDLGVEGFRETLRVLNESNLTFIGASNKPKRGYAILQKQGIRLGFLGYTEGGFNLPEKGVWINKIEQAGIIRDIESMKPMCDFIIISLHWGTENVFYPSPRQMDLAHELINAGATVVLGHHPHVIQGIEQYRDGLIAYSLGNFQFNHGRFNHSMILCLEFTKSRLERQQVIPVTIDEDFAPAPDNETGQETLNFVASISEPIKNGTITERWWFEEIAAEYLSGNMKSLIIRVERYGFRHLLQGVKWLISPFCFRCYAAIMRQRLKKLL